MDIYGYISLNTVQCIKLQVKYDQGNNCEDDIIDGYTNHDNYIDTMDNSTTDDVDSIVSITENGLDCDKQTLRPRNVKHSIDDLYIYYDSSSKSLI